jgi:ribosomal protein S18 acetylase RimI-like enzyme
VTVRVRPFADRDYAAVTRIRRIAEGEPIEVDELRRADARWDHSRYEKVRVVAADEEDAPLGYGEIHHEPTRFEPERYFLRIAVDPTKRRRGIGASVWTQLHAELVERRAGVTGLWARDHTACVDFIVRRGFREVTRLYSLVRAVATAPLPTPALEERLAASGVRISSLAELVRDDPAAYAKAYELFYASWLDQPALGRLTRVPFAEWRADRVDDPAALLDAYFIATSGRDFVGQCAGQRSRSEDVLDVGSTGVLPEYRRRGIGRALKLRLHAYARAHGYRELHTANVRHNKAMLDLNDSLGYVIVESLGGYELALTPSSP